MSKTYIIKMHEGKINEFIFDVILDDLKNPSKMTQQPKYFLTNPDEDGIDYFSGEQSAYLVNYWYMNNNVNLPK